jgi:predicted RNA-binding protein associated with RNAse of E/G family
MTTTASLPIIASGDWQRQPHMKEYRSEWLNDMLVERASWDSGTPVQLLGSVTIAAPGYIWFRFWLAEGDRILDKYFDETGKQVGMYAHVGMPLPHQGRGFSIVDLTLGLWISAQMHVTVHNESAFDEAVRQGAISPVEAEHAEHQIREITTAISHKRFPPAIVRNFSVAAR